MKKITRKIVSIMLICSLVLGLAGCGSGSGNASNNTEKQTETAKNKTEAVKDTSAENGTEGTKAPQGDTIKLGVCANFSSVAIAFFYPGLLYAVKQVNEAGGINGRMVELVTRDTNGDAANLVQKLTDLKDEGVFAIIGPDSDSMAPAAALWAEENKVVMVSPSSFSTEIAYDAHSDYFFVSGLSAWGCVNAIWEDIKDKGYEKYVVIGTDGSASTDLINLSNKVFEAEQKSSVQVTGGSSDFSSVVMALQGQQPDFTVSCISATTWTSYFEQAQLMGMYDNIINYGWDFIESLYVSSLGDSYPAGHFRGVLNWPFCIVETQEQQDMIDGVIACAKDEFNQDVTAAGQMMLWYISGKTLMEAAKGLGDSFTSDDLYQAMEKVEITTPWHEYARFRPLDHVLEIPYTFGTVVWDDESAKTVKLEDVKIYNPEEILPSFEDYKAYAEETGKEFDWDNK